jgi:hypothetical protein
MATYPSFEDASQKPVFSTEVLRLLWKPFGPLQTCIRVLERPLEPSSPSQPYKTEDATTQKPVFHSISSAPLTSPPISSITVTQSDLFFWVGDWVDEHIRYINYDDNVWGPQTPSNPSYNPEHPEWGENEAGQILLRCGDSERPWPQPRLLVQPSAGSFVTVHDFVTTAHA